MQGLLAATATTPVSPADLEGQGWLSRLQILNQGDWGTGKLHMVKPADDPEIPWTALVVGLWIPNFFYWGLNQYITQRTLGSKSLAEGQKGVVFAAFLKLLIPFVVVIPGILAFNLFATELGEEATKKNAPVIEEFKQGEDKFFIFTDNFAELNPELSQQINVHNANLVKADLTSIQSSVESILAQNPDFTNWTEAKQLAMILGQTNHLLLGKNGEAPSSQKLVGYDYDAAFPTLIRETLPLGIGLKGFVLAAIFGAVVSSLASMLNSSSTIFTMDIYRKLQPESSQHRLVFVGRICVVVFVIIAMLIAPSLDNPAFGGIFTFIQEFQGFISPGILAIFLFGVLVHRAPRSCGTVGLILNPILYGALKWMPMTQDIAFLNRMAICFFAVLIVLGIMTAVAPMAKPVDLPVNEKMDMTSKSSVKFFGIGVCVLTVLLYIIFW